MCVTVTVGTAIGVLGCSIKRWFPGTSDKQGLGYVDGCQRIKHCTRVVCFSSGWPAAFSTTTWIPPSQEDAMADLNASASHCK